MIEYIYEQYSHLYGDTTMPEVDDTFNEDSGSKVAESADKPVDSGDKSVDSGNKAPESGQQELAQGLRSTVLVNVNDKVEERISALDKEFGEKGFTFTSEPHDTRFRIRVHSSQMNLTPAVLEQMRRTARSVQDVPNQE